MSLHEALFGRGRRMQTYSGAIYYPASPHTEDVRLVDIAHHLSLLCRYTGACKRFYSVAEHSVLVSYAVPREMALMGLLHDGQEAYVNDIGKPLKCAWRMWGYRSIEQENWLCVVQRFGLPAVLPREVHEADASVGRAEQKALMYVCNEQWWTDNGQPPAEVDIVGYDPEDAETLFLNRYYELTRGKVSPVLSLADAVHLSPPVHWSMGFA